MSIASVVEQNTTVNYRQRLAALLPAMLMAYLVLIWPLIYARGIVPADLATGPLPPEHSFVLNRLFFPALAGVSVLLLIAERHRLLRFHLAGFFLVTGFFGYLCMTALWALAPSVTISKAMLFAMQGIALLVAVLLTRRVEDMIKPMFWVLAVTLVINFLAIPIIPSTPIGYAGIFSHKNMLGSVAVMGGFFALYGLTRSDLLVRRVSMALMPVVLILLYLSDSKTSIGLFVMVPLFALGAVFMRRYFRVSLPVLITVVAIPAGVLLSGAIPGFSYHTVSRIISHDGTFTGRTDVWAFGVKEALKRPLTGFGYQSFWGLGDKSPASKLPDWTGFVKVTPHAHNGYLDVLLQGGMIALTLFALLQIMVALWIDKTTDRDIGLGYFFNVLFLYMLLQNLLETAWLQGLSGSSMLVTLMILLAAVQRNGERWV